MMKIFHSVAFICAMTTSVNGLSFSELNSEPALSPLVASERSDDAEMTSDEENRIYGGADADISKYSYVGTIHSAYTKGEQFCGVTLISPQYVTTAAYCLGWFSEDTFVSLGAKPSKKRGSQNAEKIRVVEVFEHPKFNSTWFTNDVAVLKLEKPSSHKPARLGDADGSDDKPKTKATVLGWGEVNQKDLPDTLQAVDVEIIPDDQCAEYTIDTDATLCAGTERGKGFCGSDMGGPLIANNVVVGIATAQPGAVNDCGELPGLYTRVSYVVDYITGIMNGGSSGNASEVFLFPATR